jgi:peroxiredoxin-like protein
MQAMQSFPHLYRATAAAEAQAAVTLTSGGLPLIESDAPTEFDGPGDKWSPESLLVAAVADCFILSFKAIARASNFSWISLSCEAVGTLDNVDRQMRFTTFEVRAALTVPPGANEDKAMRLLEKAEQACLVTNSLTAAVHLSTSVQTQ